MSKKVLKPKNRTFVQIKDETWQCYLWSNSSYKKVHGNDSGAVALVDKKELHFREDEFSIDSVGHELVHAYWTTLHLESTISLKIDDMEEIVASFIGGNFINFYQNTLHVYNELKGDLLNVG